MAVQGFSALDPESHLQGVFSSLPETDFQACTIFDKKREIRPKKPLTCEIDLEFFHVSSMLVGSLADIVSILVQTDGCSV